MPLADHLWSGFRARTVGWWYGYLGAMLTGSPIVCLNYGYAFATSSGQPVLSAEQEDMRPYLQLYHRVASLAEPQGKDLLEISCGYGGGAAYVQSAFRPRATTGLDASRSAIQRAVRRFRSPELDFLVGQADALGFPSGVFDVVLNIEASHCYPDMRRFLNEVLRVLRPGGQLILADYRPASEIGRLEALLGTADFVLEDSTDITSNVVRSLEETHDQRTEWIAHYGPGWLRPLMGQLAGVRGSIAYRSFVSGRLRYNVFRARRR